MRTMVIGGGGREHALASGLARSTRVEQVLCVPGNAGTADVAENIEVKLDDHEALIALARDREVDFTIVGPEAPLCAGIVDRFEAAGLKIFGPRAAAARIEGDKGYAKHLMRIAKIPTAEGRVFDKFGAAREYVASRESGVVVKASGLAAGKGVYVCPDLEEAAEALKSIMVDGVFGDAGNVVVVEELLKGQELSVLALVDGHTIYTLESSQDHKPVGDGDTGPNTGGMGAYSPAPIATPEVLAEIEREVLVPIVDALRNDGAPYRGVLYAGLMITAAGPKVLEFNCRFGDPEAQAVLMRLDCDLFDVLEAVVDGGLSEVDLRWNTKPAVCVVLASEGYPGAYESGKVIKGLDLAAAIDGVCVFHAGTRKLEHLTLTSGGRVLGVTALGDDIADAKRRAYTAADLIEFENKYYRRDIADKAIKVVKVT